MLVTAAVCQSQLCNLQLKLHMT